ncbi:Uncharacterized protein SCF082_LOCUS20425 [Durusdinium trenchii]|uniref:Uncharacterized protein n=1 Tax=Durusdinium trenchii TaxID=1381693 RepID=A0ABP0L295_9DINO
MATLNHLQLANSVEEALRGEGRPRENHGRGDVPFWARRQREMVNWMLNSFVGLIGARMGVAMMKAVPLVSLLVVLRRTWRLNQIMMRNRRSKVWILIRSAFEMWTLIELIFWIYFRCKKWSLEARRAYQPRVLWKARGERERLLTNFLTTIERIHVGQGYAPLREPKAGVKKKEAAQPGGRHLQVEAAIRASCSWAGRTGPAKADLQPVSRKLLAPFRRAQPLWHGGGKGLSELYALHSSIGGKPAAILGGCRHNTKNTS